MPAPANDGWTVASLSEVGVDEAKLNQAIARVKDKTYPNIHAILIVKDGKLVFEHYVSGYTWQYDDPNHQGDRVAFDRDTPHNLASVTKSVTSILVAIAIDQGAIPNIDAPVFTFFPAYADLRNARKDSMTLEHLLTMTSGFAWNEEILTRYILPAGVSVRDLTQQDGRK